jgi:hypothetical protein
MILRFLKNSHKKSEKIMAKKQKIIDINELLNDKKLVDKLLKIAIRDSNQYIQQIEQWLIVEPSKEKNRKKLPKILNSKKVLTELIKNEGNNDVVELFIPKFEIENQKNGKYIESFQIKIHKKLLYTIHCDSFEIYVEKVNEDQYRIKNNYWALFNCRSELVYSIILMLFDYYYDQLNVSYVPSKFIEFEDENAVFYIVNFDREKFISFLKEFNFDFFNEIYEYPEWKDDLFECIKESLFYAELFEIEGKSLPMYKDNFLILINDKGIIPFEELRITISQKNWLERDNNSSFKSYDEI